MPEYKEKIEFIEKHEDEIKPLLNKKEQDNLGQIEKGKKYNPEEVEKILEKFETKIYNFEKPENEYGSEAKRILIGLSNPLSFNAVSPIIEKLKQDKRCQSIALLTDNIAGKSFEEKNDDDFIKIRDKNKPVLSEIPGNFDVALFLPEAKNSPSTAVLLSGESIFGAKNTYFIVSDFFVNTAIEPLKGRLTSETKEIDGILCVDELQKRILIDQLPDFSPEKIFVTGTPIIDNLETDKAKEYEKAGRRKLNLDDKTKTILYLGDISFECQRIAPGADEKINEKTYEQTAKSVIKLAGENPEQNFALLVRPHPRDPNREELLTGIKIETPKNLKIIPATNDIVSINEVCYAADFIISIIGTENLLAPARGRKSVFLGYEDPGMGKIILDKFIHPLMLKEIKENADLKIVGSPEELTDFLEENIDYRNFAVSAPKRSESEKDKKTSVDKILDIIFSKKS